MPLKDEDKGQGVESVETWTKLQELWSSSPVQSKTSIFLPSAFSSVFVLLVCQQISTVSKYVTEWWEPFIPQASKLIILDWQEAQIRKQLAVEKLWL